MLLCVGGGPVSRQKIREVLLSQFVFRDSAENVVEPGPFINTTGLAGGKQGVDHGCPLGGLVIAAEQIVLTPNSKGPDAIFHHVVVYLVTTVGNIQGELLDDIVGVGDGTLHQGLRRALQQGYLHPGLVLLRMLTLQQCPHEHFTCI